MRTLALEHGAHAAEINEAFQRGGEGAIALAEAVVDAAEQPNSFDFAYPLDAPIEEKIRAIVTKVYGGDGVQLLPAAKEKAAAFEQPVSATCRSAWPRPTSRCRTTRRSGTRRPASR